MSDSATTRSRPSRRHFVGRATRQAPLHLLSSTDVPGSSRCRCFAWARAPASTNGSITMNGVPVTRRRMVGPNRGLPGAPGVGGKVAQRSLLRAARRGRRARRLRAVRRRAQTPRAAQGRRRAADADVAGLQPARRRRRREGRQLVRELETTGRAARTPVPEPWRAPVLPLLRRSRSSTGLREPGARSTSSRSPISSMHRAPPSWLPRTT